MVRFRSCNDLLCYRYNLNKLFSLFWRGFKAGRMSEATVSCKAIKQVRSVTDAFLIDVINKIVVTLLGTEIEQHHKSNSFRDISYSEDAK